MKFYIPIDFYSRYSFRSRGHLMLENMDSSHGFVTNIEEVIGDDLYVFGKNFGEKELDHCIKNNINFVIDISDYKFHKNKIKNLYEESSKYCKKFVATCKFLAQSIENMFDKECVVIPDPTERKKGTPEIKIINPNDKIKLVTYGAHKNLRSVDFTRIVESLQEVHKNIELKVVCNNPVFGPVEYVEWNFEIQEKIVNEADFVLIPIDYEDKKRNYLRSKGNNRPIDAIQQGKYVITSDTIPSYVDLKPFLWAGDLTLGLEDAIKNPAKAYRKVRKGQQHIDIYYTPSHVAQMWLELERSI